jgi:hypothetical protein
MSPVGGIRKNSRDMHHVARPASAGAASRRQAKRYSEQARVMNNERR